MLRGKFRMYWEETLRYSYSQIRLHALSFKTKIVHTYGKPCVLFQYGNRPAIPSRTSLQPSVRHGRQVRNNLTSLCFSICPLKCMYVNRSDIKKTWYRWKENWTFVTLISPPLPSRRPVVIFLVLYLWSIIESTRRPLFCDYSYSLSAILPYFL